MPVGHAASQNVVEVQRDLCASARRLGVFSDNRRVPGLRQRGHISGDSQGLQDRDFFVRGSEVVATRPIDLSQDIKDPGSFDRD